MIDDIAVLRAKMARARENTDQWLRRNKTRQQVINDNQTCYDCTKPPICVLDGRAYCWTHYLIAGGKE